jgi:hypothetical protein
MAASATLLGTVLRQFEPVARLTQSPGRCSPDRMFVTSPGPHRGGWLLGWTVPPTVVLVSTYHLSPLSTLSQQAPLVMPLRPAVSLVAPLAQRVSLPRAAPIAFRSLHASPIRSAPPPAAPPNDEADDPSKGSTGFLGVSDAATSPIIPTRLLPMPPLTLPRRPSSTAPSRPRKKALSATMTIRASTRNSSAAASTSTRRSPTPSSLPIGRSTSRSPRSSTDTSWTADTSSEVSSSLEAGRR